MTTVRFSLLLTTAVLAGFTLGVLTSGLWIRRQTTHQLSELRAETTVLLQAIDKVATAGTFPAFAHGVSGIGVSVKAFVRLSFPRVQPLADEVSLALLQATSDFLDAAICWADYENPGRSALANEPARARLSKADLGRVIDEKHRALEQRMAYDTANANLDSKIAEQRLALAEAETAQSGENVLARARARAEVERITEVKLAAAQCVQQRRGQGVRRASNVDEWLAIPR
ncbi:MAG: hypothetical protein HY355_02815 [Armatimonadetes bacterium]|nr:hypothetical protein [Armatimonadota bacterium]